MANFTGTSGDDQLWGTQNPSDLTSPTNDTFAGLAGNDTLGGGRWGTAQIDGGPGDDVAYTKGGMAYTDNAGTGVPVSIYSSTVTANLGPGRDVMLTYGSNGTLDGGAGFDLLVINESLFSTAARMGSFGGKRMEPSGSLSFVVDTAAGKAGSTGYLKLAAVSNNDRTGVLNVFDNAFAYTQTIRNFEAVALPPTDDTYFGSDRPLEFVATGGGRDTIDGRGGIDVVHISRILSDVRIDLNAGTASYDSSDTGSLVTYTSQLRNIEGALGGIGHDLIRGDGGDNYLFGGPGRDTLQGGAGEDTLLLDVRALTDLNAPGMLPRISPSLATVVDLGSGSFDDEEGSVDRISGIEHIFGGPGTETLTGDGKNNRLEGRDGNDTLNGEDGEDTLKGGKGDDEIHGGQDNDTILGDDNAKSPAGNDLLHGDGGEDSIRGYGGNDTLYGGTMFDRLFGDDGHDEMHGDAGGDILFGGDGRDSLFGGDDDDMMDGGAKNDELRGEGGKDELFGRSGKDTLIGGAQNDILDGGLDDDRMEGGRGDDRFIPGKGLDVLIGGPGRDTLDLSNAKSKVTVDLGAHDFNGGGYGRNTIREVEVIFGSKFADQITGGSDDEELFGGKGNDTIEGGRGRDSLSGDLGADTLRGGEGRDTLYGDSGGKGAGDLLEGGEHADELYGAGGRDTLRGGKGDDTLHGGKGNDVLYGGLGDDTFVFTKGGKTTVKDFDPASDIVDVSLTGWSLGALAYAAAQDDGKGNVTLAFSQSGGGPVLLLEGVDYGLLGPGNFDA